MKLWQGAINFTDGVMLVWRTSKRECERDTASIATDVEGTVMTVKPIDIPTDRRGLAGWLDRNFNMDNG